ncbi:MAG: hypothetical protein Q4G27_05775 [Flavobacteriaceae bacterium]|nr:hypothetical protein [Flavobacteriaceae bacterium]
MNKLSTLIIAITGLLGFQWVNAQSQVCNQYEIQLNKEVQAKNYEAAYPILNQALNECPNEKVNFYNFGETILLAKINSAANETDKKKFAGELVSLINKRIQYFPEGKVSFWEGEKITYQLNHGLVSKKEAYQQYQKLFGQSEEAQKISASAATNYFVAVIELLNAEEIDYNAAMEGYFQAKKVADGNIEMRSVEYGTLAEKLDSIQKENPKKDLTPAEKQTMSNAQAAKDLFVQLSEGMESALSEIAKCEYIAPMFEQDFEKNKDNIDWLAGSYQALASKDCYDHPIMDRLEKQYVAVWQKNNPSQPIAKAGGTSSSSTIGSEYGNGVKQYNAGNYSGAIASFTKALNEVSGTTRGDVAYYMALAYQKTGSNANAVTWANRAASYKPGWGAPYQLIAGAFAASANSCGNSEFQKRAAYWVAADYANKACAVDSRSCSWGRSAAKSYEGNAPTVEQAFQAGKKSGDAVTVSCLGGATTRVR